MSMDDGGGGGGVMCVPSQQQQHVGVGIGIEKKLVVADGEGKCGSNAGSNGGIETQTPKVVRKKKVKVRKVKVVKKVVKTKSCVIVKRIENGEVSGTKVVDLKDEVEEGELGTLENGECRIDESTSASMVEKEEVRKEGVGVSGNLKRNEENMERGILGKWQPDGVANGDGRDRSREYERTDYGSWRRFDDELEKGEFIPERRPKWENSKDECSYGKMRRQEYVKDKDWKYERDYESPIPSGKYYNDDSYQNKRFNWISGGHPGSRGARGNLESDLRGDSENGYQENFNKHEQTNGNKYGRDYSSTNRLKQHGNEYDNWDPNYFGDFGNYMSSKSRKLSDNRNRVAHHEHYSGRSMERPFRNASSSSLSNTKNHSSRNGEYPMSYKGVADRHARSPGRSDLSPHDGAQYHSQYDRSPLRRERSPLIRKERSLHDRKERSPYAQKERPQKETSPHDRKEKSPHNQRVKSSHNRKDRSPRSRRGRSDIRKHSPAAAAAEQSPQDQSHLHSRREQTPKLSSSKKGYNQVEAIKEVEKMNQREAINNSSLLLNTENGNENHEKDHPVSPVSKCKETPQINHCPEDVLSMEEDMDICDTPPHTPVVVDSASGKWVYLDNDGKERGPSKLCDLKELVNAGALVSDHMIKHLDTNRWVTIENAVSPMITLNILPIASNNVTQLVTPPEASGNLLVDTVESEDRFNQLEEETPKQGISVSNGAFQYSNNFHIDERVGALLNGVAISPGREMEIIEEALHTRFEHFQWDELGTLEGFYLHQSQCDKQVVERIMEPSTNSKNAPREDPVPITSFDMDFSFSAVDSNDWFSDQWSCRGGDWMRHDENLHDKLSRRKLVLNDGFPLCGMPKSGYEDPRWGQDELYYPSQSRRLDLPNWAFSCANENMENGATKLVARIAKGSMLPVVRINACVVTDHGVSAAEPHIRSRGRDKPSSRAQIPISTPNDIQCLPAEGCFSSRNTNERDSESSLKSGMSINYPKDRLCTVNDLQLHLGDWYYHDGSGQERGPLSFSKLQMLVDKASIQRHSSVFRKDDNIWVPITSMATSSSTQEEKQATSENTSGYPIPHTETATLTCSSFHSLYPQFIGFARGKLYELIMKSFKNREFAAAINEVLDPWISAKQPKKELEKHFSNPSFSKRPSPKNRIWKLDVDQVIEEYKGEGLKAMQMDVKSFEELCGDAVFHEEHGHSHSSEFVIGSWQILDGHILARIFHSLRTDIMSTVLASLTCKSWRSAAKFYMSISGHIDLSSLGSLCTDEMIWNIMSDYTKENITSIVLSGCTNVTSTMLEQILPSFPYLSTIDIRGCPQLEDVDLKFPTLRWIKSLNSLINVNSEASNYKSRSIQSTEASNTSKVDDFDHLRDYFDSVDRRESVGHLFRQSLYKRSKVFDARKSSSIKSRDARVRRWDTKKSDTGIKNIEEFTSLQKNRLMKAKSRHKRKLDFKAANKKNASRSLSTSSTIGSPENYSSDRESCRRFLKLNKKSMHSGNSTSDDGLSSEDGSSESERTASDTASDLDFQAEGGTGDWKGDEYLGAEDGSDSTMYDREWGARMTKASLVPPVTRKYELIDHYVIVTDEEKVRLKMKVSLPDDYADKLMAQKSGTEDMEIPEVKDFKPRKLLGQEVIEQEVYGIDPYTHNLILDSMSMEVDWTLLEKHLFIEDVILRTLNRQVRCFTGTGNTPMIYPLQPVIEDILKTAEEARDLRTKRMSQSLLKAMATRPIQKYVAYRKGLGVVCNKKGGFTQDDFVVEFLGEVYPAWRWFEKQDGIRSLQKNTEDPAPEFYNINLERPKGDADGYDLVIVDAMHKANYASRICHSCRPNCEAKVTAVDGKYQIGIYTLREIQYGEEISFDYNSVTESKEEYEASVCLCGSQVCRGSYLNLTGEGAFLKVLEQSHGVLDRHHLMIEACELNVVTEEDLIDFQKAGLGRCLLDDLPDWLISYTARLVRFINFERTKLPDEILRHNVEEKRKYKIEIDLEVEKSDAEIQAEGVFNQRLQNLALTLDKVKYVMKCVFGDPKRAPPPLERLTPAEAVSFIWKGEGSFVEELLQCVAPHMEDYMINDLRNKIRARNLSSSSDLEKELRSALLWLRDEVRYLPCSSKCRHDAAADLIHIYAYTKCFFRIREYKTVTSPPVVISPLDLGPKYIERNGAVSHKFSKTYGENYCLGQLINWHNQMNANPDCSLAKASRGCLSLPIIGSFYAKLQTPSRQRVYGSRTLRFMISRMEKYPQRPWPKDRIWSFDSSPKVVGSPMLDAIVCKQPLSKEMLHWLKNRPAMFQATSDR